MTPSHMTIRNAVLGAWASVAEARRSVSKHSGATAVALLLTAIAPHARAFSCSVTNNTDAGANSLRGCVADANASDPGANANNVINATGAQTITSPTGSIAVTENTEIGTGGDALTYQPTGGASGLVIPGGTNGVHLVLGQNFTLTGPHSTANANFQAVSIGSAGNTSSGNTVDLLGTIDMSGGITPLGRMGIVANGDDNVLNISGTIKGISSGGAAIKTTGDQNTINVSGTLSSTTANGVLGGSIISATGNSNVVNVSGTINAIGASTYYGINMQGNGNLLNVSGSINGTLGASPFAGSNGAIGVTGDNNIIDISGTVAVATGISANSHDIDVSGTNNAIIVRVGATVSAVPASTVPDKAIVFSGTGTSSLTNYGTIVGGVTMGNGASTLSIGTGSSISGAVTGGTSGNNTLRLIGNGTDSYDGTFTNFQALEVNAAGGMWTLLNNQSYANGVNLLNGTLSVNSILGGAMAVRGGRLQGTGTVGDTTNYAGGTIAPGNGIGTLQINGNYTGSGGALEIESALGGTGSPADRLLVSGNATGTTMVHVINTGGNGALTGTGSTDGISIIQVAGTSAADTFQLAGGYAAAGPYQYKLNVFDPAGSAAGEVDPRLGATPFYDYRLQSVVDASGNPVAVPQIAGYQALPTGAVRYGASLLDSVHQRLGELRRLGVAGNGSDGQNNQFFLRAQGSSSDVSGNHASGYDQDIWFTQAGGNVFGKDMEDGSTLRIGGAFSYGESKLSADGSSAKVNLEGTSLALTSTYQAAAGWYLDGVAQLTKYSADIKTSERGQTGSPDGLGYALSLEGGYPFDLGGGLVIEPQAQLSYQKIKFDRFTDVDNISVDLRDGESLRGRFGGRIQKTFDANTTRAWSPYIEANLLHEFLGAGSIRASDVSFASDSLGTSLQLGGGINAQMGVNKMVFASVSYESGLSDAAANAWSGNVGMRIDF